MYPLFIMCTLKRIQIRKSNTYKYLFEDQTHSSETRMIQYPENKEHNVRRAIQVPKTHEMVLTKVQVVHVHLTAYVRVLISTYPDVLPDVIGRNQ